MSFVASSSSLSVNAIVASSKVEGSDSAASSTGELSSLSLVDEMRSESIVASSASCHSLLLTD